MTYLFPALFGCVSLVHLYTCLPPERQPLRSITKCLLMPLLLAVYFVLRNPNSWLLSAALFFSFWGDLFLIMDNHRPAFLGGLGAFAVSHVLYCVHFLRLSSGTLLPAVVIPALFLYATLLDLLLRRILKRIPRSFALPCVCYMLLIASMNVLALNAAAVQGTVRSWLDFLGAVLFCMSDFVLCINMFYKHRSWHSCFIMAMYIAAQVLIVL